MNKYQLLTGMYMEACDLAASSSEHWKQFLQCASRNFRLRFDEQLLVYLQKPSATAVLEINDWNGKFGRWVNKGASGIAVFGDQRGGRQRVRYYFDLSDTHEGYRSRPVPLWTMRPEDEPAVIETLENSFGELADKRSVGEAVLSAASNLAEDNLQEYLRHLVRVGRGSLIGKEAPERQEEIVKQLATKSVACMMMTRLGIDTSAYPEVNDFAEIAYFNHHDVLTLIGSASSDIARTALAEISGTIRSVQKENRTVDDRDADLYNMIINGKGGNKFETKR